MSPRQRRAWILFALLMLLLILLFDWNWYKRPVQLAVESATGRSFRIEGDLDVNLALFRPTVVANGVVLGNTEWSEQDEMLRVERAEIQWAFWHLFTGRVYLPQVRLTGAALHLERDQDRRANWRFSDEPKDDSIPAYSPDIGQLWLTDSRLRLVEKPFRTDLAVELSSGRPADGEYFPPLLLSGTGTLRDNDFQLQGRIDSPTQLAESDEPFRIDLEARAGATRARATGSLVTPLQLEDFDLGFEISGDDMAQLYPLLGLAIPTTSAYQLEGRLARVAEVWSYRDMQGVMGDSDLAGEVIIDATGERTLLRADLQSERLDFDDLAGFVGGQPRVGEGAQPVQATPGARLFPDKAYEVDKLRAMDADVRLRARRVTSPALPLESMDGHLLLEDGLLRLDPLSMGIGGGQVDAVIELDARQSPLAANVQLTARRLELPKLVPDSAPESTGRIGAQIALRGRGDSVADFMASANGDLDLAMGPGRISNLTLELAGLDFAEALRFMLGKDQVVPVRCGFADFTVAEGTMTLDNFAFDTTDTLLLAEGSVDLGEESLDLVLRPRPKDASPFTLRSPLRVGGTFKSPTIRPQGGPLLLRTAAAAALYALAPPAALLALVETGPGENADCLARTVPES
ncbi:AsmA family protein [Arenimonas alkanexedens]